MWWKSKREKQLERLVELLQEKISDSKKAEDNFINRFVCVDVPRQEDMDAYWQKMSMFITDPLFVFYFTKSRTDILMEFEESGKEDAEFLRGKLAAIGAIIKDARRAQMQLEIPKDGQI